MKMIRNPLAVLFTLLFLLGGVQSYAAEETAAQPVAVVNVNTATAEELSEVLVGVGESRAALIVQYREQHGEFTSVEQLLEIKGIGMATLEKNKERIQL
ncbi:ComEA family DNA-binding protein [uncultured Microbulbifer sp.]|uniref:ComEA family DNA-binding protein n=1 Tax=uncultured Microbulbifer sp. TaxID=348147 RepID=UPI0025F8F0DC|nr:ComEA family DNA-binding protein [uncultured Microbulbifer sp.]